MWLGSLVDALNMNYSAVVKHLGVCNIPVQRSKGYDYIRVPGPAILKHLLTDDGFDVDILKPCSATLNGEPRHIKWIENPRIASDGCVLFRVTWTGKHSPSTVCCHQLNSAARYYVHISLRYLNALTAFFRCNTTLVCTYQTPRNSDAQSLLRRLPTRPICFVYPIQTAPYLSRFVLINWTASRSCC